MNPRTTQILEAVMREFIETGSPVSSRALARKYDWDIKDATVRNELHLLTEEGFLEQPHTSAGRVPTDRGYQFLVTRITAQSSDGAKGAFGRIASGLSAEFSKGRFEDFIDDFAEELSVLSVGYAEPEQEIYKSGLDDLFERLSEDHWFNNIKEACRIVDDFENLDSRMEALMDFMQDGSPRVFIGRSPITKSRKLSVIADAFDIDGEKFILAAVGPKRMDYERGIGLFKALRKSIKK